MLPVQYSLLTILNCPKISFSVLQNMMVAMPIDYLSLVPLCYKLLILKQEEKPLRTRQRVICYRMKKNKTRRLN